MSSDHMKGQFKEQETQARADRGEVRSGTRYNRRENLNNPKGQNKRMGGTGAVGDMGKMADETADARNRNNVAREQAEARARREAEG